MELMYLIRTRARTPERRVESIRRRVAEKALCEAEGCRRAKRLRRCGAGIGASSGSRIGLGSSFAVTGLVGLILSVGLMLMGWRGWFALRIGEDGQRQKQPQVLRLRHSQSARMAPLRMTLLWRVGEEETAAKAATIEESDWRTFGLGCFGLWRRR